MGMLLSVDGVRTLSGGSILLEVPSFSSLEIELLRYGFHKVFYSEIYCPDHGGWRCAVEESFPVLPCPQCGLLREATAIAVGFARHPGKWERWEAPLSATARASLLAEIDEARKIRREQKHGQERSHHYATGNEIDPKDFTWESVYARDFAKS